MKVEPELLHAGAAVTHAAAERIASGANRLASACLPRGMFGNFDAAHSFHSSIQAHHWNHVSLMRQHDRVLTNIGDKAHAAGHHFTRTEEENAAAVTAVGRGLG